MQTRLLINGKLVAGEGKVEEVLNAATGKVIAKVPEASRAQIDAAVKAADAAFDGWARTAPKDRATMLLKLADRIEADGADYDVVDMASLIDKLRRDAEALSAGRHQIVIRLIADDEPASGGEQQRNDPDADEHPAPAGSLGKRRERGTGQHRAHVADQHADADHGCETVFLEPDGDQLQHGDEGDRNTEPD